MNREFGNNDLAKEFVLLQDNCALHTGPAAREFFRTDRINVLKTSPVSPDLNPVESAWYLVERKLSHYLLTNFISTPEILFDKVVEFASQIPIETIDNLIDTMPKRIREYYEKDGCATH